jgi:hypothetical protein
MKKSPRLLSVSTKFGLEYYGTLGLKHVVNKNDKWWGEELISKRSHPEDVNSDYYCPVILFQMHGPTSSLTYYKRPFFKLNFDIGMGAQHTKVAFVYLRNLFRRPIKIYGIPRIKPNTVHSPIMEEQTSIRCATENYFQQCMFCGGEIKKQSSDVESSDHRHVCIFINNPLQFRTFPIEMLLFTECVVRKDIRWSYAFNRGVLFTSIYDKHMEMSILVDLFAPEMYIYKRRVLGGDSNSKRPVWKEYTLFEFLKKYAHEQLRSSFQRMMSNSQSLCVIHYIIQIVQNNPLIQNEHLPRSALNRNQQALLARRYKCIKSTYRESCYGKLKCCCRHPLFQHKSELKKLFTACMNCKQNNTGLCRGGRLIKKKEIEICPRTILTLTC